MPQGAHTMLGGVGVLSGGYDFFGRNNRYGDTSFYNPLFPFFEFITEKLPFFANISVNVPFLGL